MANASQEHNQKQATEAVREGNVEQQQAQQEQANDRKQQLANWDELAPRIIEDPLNRAVRIDIPGVVDVETLIVRMKQNSVSIQAVGSKSAMDSLQARESELSQKLRSHNVTLGQLQAFDKASLGGGAQAVAA